MKIAMMTNNYKPFVGGVPISVERLAQGLRARGHEVCIFAPDYGTEEAEEDVVRIRTFSKTLTSGMAVPDIRDKRIGEAFECRNFDLIHVHQPMLVGNLALHLARQYQLPLVYTYHTQYAAYLHHVPFLADKKLLTGMVKKALPFYMNHFMKQCSMIFAPSGEIREYLEKQAVPSVCVLPTGLDAASYQPDRTRSEAIRRQYGAGKKYLLCTVARLEQEKNLYVLLRAAAALQQRLGDCFRLLLVGEGSERMRLQEYAQSLGLSDAAVFVGAVPNTEVKDYLFAGDLFWFASKSETQGIVLAEAMAAGLPVVAVEACGTRDIVVDGVNGCLTEESAEMLALRAAKVLESNDLHERMSRAALDTAYRYHAEQISLTAQQAYQRVLLERKETWEHAGTHFLRIFKAS